MKKHLLVIAMLSFLGITAASNDEKFQQKKQECIALETQVKNIEKEIEETRNKILAIWDEIINKQLFIENKDASKENLKIYGDKLVSLMQKFSEEYLVNKNISLFDNIISSEFTSLNKVDEALCKFYNLKIGFQAAQLEVLLKKWGRCLQEFYELYEKLEQK